jgi:protein-disulfide isomerase
MQPLHVTATCTFHYSAISNPRATSQERIALIVPARASANAHCSFSTNMARLHGVIVLRSRLIPVRMEFLTPSKNSQTRQMQMATLKIPITQHDHIRGPAHAPITLVEYGDYECPHCALAYPIVSQVQLSFSGRIRFVFRHFPLTEVHPHAEIAAESAEFAGAAGLFWDMHDALFQNQSRLSVTTIFLIGEELGLPETALRNALETGQYRNRVHRDLWAAYAAA